MASRKFYFRCRTNPSASPLVLHTAWEAREMANHPDYEQIDEFGEVIIDEMAEAEQEAIPMDVATRGRAVA